MSFIGDFASASASKAIGRYNNKLYQQQAEYTKAKAEVNKKVFQDVTKPMLVKAFDSNYSDFFVKAIKTGAEFRAGESTYLAALDFKTNQAFDLVMAEYNSDMDYIDQQNNANLLISKGQGAEFEGNLQAKAAKARGYGSLLSSGFNYYNTGRI